MNFPFLPHRLRWVGYLLAGAGIVIGILWVATDFEPDWLRMHVFAVYSRYIRTVVMGMTMTNIIDEVTAFLILSGGIWLIGTKEKEENALTERIRYRALYLSVLLNAALLLFGILFIFGIGFIALLMFNIISQVAIFLVCFRIMLWHSGNPHG